LILDDADVNFLPLKGPYPDKDEIKFHHKSFIDYLLDPSRSLEYCVNKEEMNTRLALACLITMQTFSLKPTSRIACFTWGYATLCWTHHVPLSKISQRNLLQALMSFDLFACYLDTLGPIMESKCRDTLKRLAFSSRPSTVISKIAEKLCPKKDIIDKTCPNFHDIEVAREFLCDIGGAGYDFVISSYWRGMERVVNWMQRNPDSPPKLIRQYQVVVNILKHYSNTRRRRRRRPPTPSDDYFRNVHKATGFSIVNSWTNVKKLMKRNA